MEASAIMKVVYDAFYNSFFIIDVIVSNNDIILRASLKHPSKGARGQVLESSKGKIDEEIQEPYFLADPPHGMKAVAKNIFYIVNKSRARRCGCIKADELWLKKYWGYMINNDREKTIEELSEASEVPLEHIFNSHENWSVEWCFNTRSPE